MKKSSKNKPRTFCEFNANVILKKYSKKVRGKTQKTQIQLLTQKAKDVMRLYQKEYPDVKMDRDYLPFKITEEWGECLQAYLMLTDRGRQKGKNKKEIQDLLAKEFADVFAYLLLFAENEKVDLVKSFDKKWLSYLKNRK